MLDPSVSVNTPTRLVLEGVPRIHFYEGGPRCPEDVCLPSVLRAYLEYLGDDDLGCKHCLAVNPSCKVYCSYSFFMGVTGAAAFLSWKKGWHGDNVAIFYMSPDPAAPERRAFAAMRRRLFGSRPIGVSIRRPGCTSPHTSAMYSLSTRRS